MSLETLGGIGKVQILYSPDGVGGGSTTKPKEPTFGDFYKDQLAEYYEAIGMPREAAIFRRAGREFKRAEKALDKSLRQQGRRGHR